MKAFISFCFCLLLTIPAFSRGEEYVLPKDLIIALPSDGSVKMRWVAPPLPEDKVRKASFSCLKFHTGPGGVLWMGYDKKSMSNLYSGYTVNLNAVLDDFIWLDDKALFILSDKSIGYIPIVNADEGIYKPVCSLPVERAAMAGNGKGLIFVYGYDKAAKNYAVYRWSKQFDRWSKVFFSNTRVAAVCASDSDLYIAAGRTVYKLDMAKKKASIVFEHSLDTITALACTPGAGIFYATYNGIGVVNRGAVEFIKCKGAQIEVKDKKLYVYMPDSLGVLCFENIERLAVSK